MSTSTSGQQQSTPCVICSGPTNGIWHYGVECCRACASFFHRSIKERRDYSCRNRGNCIINNDNGLRNSCRACRLKKCLEVGMELTETRNMKNNNGKDDDPPLPSLNLGSSSSLVSSAFPSLLTTHSVPGFNMNCNSNNATSSTAMESSSNLPETQNLLNSIRQFEYGMRALAIVEGLLLDMIGGEKQFKLLTSEEFQKVDKGISMLACVMTVEYMPEVIRFPKETKYKFFKYFAQPFIYIHRAKMTDKYFPDSESPYGVIIPGGVLDRNRMDIILKDVCCAKAKPEYREKFRRCFIEKHFEIVKKLYPSLHISDREFAVLTGLMFWRGVEHLANDFVPPSLCGVKRDAFYAELVQIILEELQQKQQEQQANGTREMETESKVAIRFGKLVDFLHQLTIFFWELNELTDMAKIFMDMPDLWDEMVPT